MIYNNIVFVLKAVFQEQVRTKQRSIFRCSVDSNLISVAAEGRERYSDTRPTGFAAAAYRKTLWYASISDF